MMRFTIVVLALDIAVAALSIWILMSMGILWIASTGVFALALWFAPDGWQDEDGFHLGRPE